MKNPEYYLGNDAEFEFFSFHEVIDMIAKAQKDAYNQAIQDVEINIECCMEESNGFKYPTVKWDSISKLKIK